MHGACWVPHCHFTLLPHGVATFIDVEMKAWWPGCSRLSQPYWLFSGVVSCDPSVPVLRRLLTILNIALGHVTGQGHRAVSSSMHWSPRRPTPEHTPLLPLRLPLCHESPREGGLKGMAWSQKKRCPLLKGVFPGGNMGGCPAVCPSGTGTGHFPPHSCLPISASVAPAPELPPAFSSLFKFSGASLELKPWPSPQRASDLSLTSELSRDPMVPAFSCSALWEA